MQYQGATAGRLVMEKHADEKENAARTTVPPTVRGKRWRDRILIGYGRAFEHPCKVRLVRWLIGAFARGQLQVTNASGAAVALDPQDFIGWEIFKTGSYEPASVALACSIMAAERGLFVDVGAHFGWYTLAVAPIPGTVVISVEADSHRCSQLRENIRRNGLQNVVIANVAAAPGPELLQLAARSPHNSGTVAVCSGQPPAGADRYWVAGAPLQAILDRVVTPPARPALLKMDVEGFEPQALAGLDLDGPFRPKHIIIECEPLLFQHGWKSIDEFAEFFSDHGYVLHDVFGRPFACVEDLPEGNVWARDLR